MSDAEPILVTAFEGQRRALELTHRAIAQGVDVQRRAVRSFADSVDAQRAANRRATEFVDSAFETSLLLANVAVPGDGTAFEELEYRFDEQLEAFGELQDGTWELFSRSIEDGLATYERFADVYADAVDASFDAAVRGTDVMSDEVAGLAGRRERAVQIEIEAEES